MRLDQALVDRRLTDSRARAQAAISAGQVRLNGVVVHKASTKVKSDDEIGLNGDILRWVSRAALKLDHALNEFDVDVSGLVALDLGASTGGFSEVLLARGAQFVTAIDVGHGQLAERLRRHDRLRHIEGLNARDIASVQIEPPDLIVSDMSFISLTKALPAALDLAGTGAQLVALVKPQFELSRSELGKNGIVKDQALRQKALRSVTVFLEGRRWRVLGVADSPIFGGDGNAEFLVHARKDSGAG